MKGLILAAGRGERFRLRSGSLPKALIPISGRPMIEYPLLNFKKAGLREVGIVVALGEKTRIQQALKGWEMDFAFLIQEIPQGTARALEIASEFLGQDTFLLAYCDLITPYDFNKIIEEHKRHRPLATLLVNPVRNFVRQSGEIGISNGVNKEKSHQETGLVLWKGELVTKIVEKPKEKFSDYGAAGLMILEPSVFEALSEICPSAEGEYHIGDALQSLIDKGKEVRYKIIDTWRVNVNRWEDVKKAEELILRYPNLQGL